MAAWRVAQWALAVAVIAALVIAADAGTSSRPRLKPLAGVHDGELVMDTGNALELECEGTGPLSWSAPCIVNEFKDQCDITTSGNSSKLSIKQAYFNDTGYYKCYTEGLSEEFDAVYVYVRDPLKPFVIDKQMTHVTAAQYKEAILDCRTTDPEIKVELYDIGHQRIPLGEHPSDGLVVSWEPHQGFVLAHVDLKHSDLYMCNVSGDGRAEAEAGAPAASLLMNLVVMPMTTSVPRPTIEAREATPHALLGQNVTLTCNVEMYHGDTFIIMWERPENVSAVFLLGVSLAQPLALDTSRTLGTRPLTLFDVKPEDAGNYTCRVTDYSGLSSETTFELIVGGETEGIQEREEEGT